jgi:hypothetical protein
MRRLNAGRPGSDPLPPYLHPGTRIPSATGRRGVCARVSPRVQRPRVQCSRAGVAAGRGVLLSCATLGDAFPRHPKTSRVPPCTHTRTHAPSDMPCPTLTLHAKRHPFYGVPFALFLPLYATSVPKKQAKHNVQRHRLHDAFSHALNLVGAFEYAKESAVASGIQRRSAISMLGQRYNAAASNATRHRAPNRIRAVCLRVFMIRR